MNKKILSAAVAMALAAGISGTALAAEGSLADVPKDHWSYDAVNQLVKDGIIDGMPDGTYAGDRAISRYEMAVIVARATDKMEAANIADRALIEKMQAEYGSELKTLAADVQDLKNEVGKVKFNGMFRATYDHDDDNDTINRGNDRFYMDLHGEYKVNDNWTAKFQSETNHKYSDKHSKHDGSDTGIIQRIWADGYFPNSGAWVSIGRTWRGLGFTNTLQGGETDGIQAGIPIKGTGLTASAFYMAPSWEGNGQSYYGVATWGSIGHAVDVNLAYEKAKLSKGDTHNYKDREWVYDAKTGAGKWTDVKCDEVQYDSAFAVGAKWKIVKNLSLTGDYIQSNAENFNKAAEARIDYKGTNLQDPGSFGVYARYFKFGKNAGNPDDEWGSRPNNAKGWIFGVKYVPVKNVEWSTLYSQQKKGIDATETDRNLFRTEVDFHF